MSHTCHAIDCKVEVPPAMFMCRRHWFSLPANMRRTVWQLYRKDQIELQNPSREYCQHAVNCIRFIAAKEHKLVSGTELELQMYLQYHSPLEGVVRVRAS